MGLKSLYASQDDIPEGNRDFYKEDGDKFVLDIEGIDDHPKVRGVITANRENVRKRDEYKRQVEELTAKVEGLPDDFDVVAYEALKAQADGKEIPKTDEQVTRVREQMERKHQADIAKREERIAVLEGQIRRATVDDGLSRAMDEANVDPKHKAKLLPYLKSIGAIKLEETGGDFKAIVETDMGPVPLSRFVGDWAASEDGKDYVSKPSGPEARGNNGRIVGAEPNPWSRDSFNLTRQGEIARADPAKAQRFKLAAGAA